MLKAIIADDEVLTIEMLMALIDWQGLGIELCAIAKDGRQALAAYREHKPDLIISDIRMPQMDGLSLAKEIHRLDETVQIIMISAHADFEYARTALQVGCVDYIVKPIDEIELEKTLHKVVERIRQQQNLDQNLPVSPYSQSVGQAIDLLRAEYNCNMSLDDICETVSVSKNYFCHLFKKETGQSIWSYLTELRLEHARQLLRTTHLKSYEVAYRVGYDNPAYFSKLFKKRYDLTPNEFRQNQASDREATK